MRRKINVGTIVFYSIYVIFIIAFAFGVNFLLSKLYTFLDNYEKALPKYEAEQIFTDYYSPVRFDALYEKEGIQSLSSFEDKSDFVRYMENVVKDKEITYREVSAGLGDDKKYCIYADGNKFSEFFITKKQSPESPSDTWELKSVKTYFKTEQSVSVQTVKTSKLYLNGIEVPSENITQDDIETATVKHMPEGVSGIYHRTYKIDGLLLQPELKVIDRNGKESTLIFDEEKQMFVEQIGYDEFDDTKKALLENAVQTYAKYMTLDSSLYNVRKYFDSTSKTYTYIRTADTWCYTPHIGFEFKDIEFSELYQYDENTFSARYKCNHYVYRTQTDHFLFPLDLTLYFKNINGTFYAYDMVSNY